MNLDFKVNKYIKLAGILTTLAFGVSEIHNYAHPRETIVTARSVPFNNHGEHHKIYTNERTFTNGPSILHGKSQADADIMQRKLMALTGSEFIAVYYGRESNPHMIRYIDMRDLNE